MTGSADLFRPLEISTLEFILCHAANPTL